MSWELESILERAPEYAPGTLVWYLSCEFIDGVVTKDKCQLVLVIRKPSQEECRARGFAGNIKISYLILNGEKIKITSSAWLFPLNAFPLESE
jgi:hypothetical protein